MTAERLVQPPGPVLVTGGNGYIGSWVVKELLGLGFDVHATVRDATDPIRTEPLRALDQGRGALKLFAADLLQPAAFEHAMIGCEVVFHTASPVALRGVKDTVSDLIEPATQGTRNVLETATRTTTVKRVVLTSSVAAIYGDAVELEETEGRRFDESHWNETSSESHQPYSFSKMLAERLAWRIAGSQDRWDLVVLNPALTLGPALTKHSRSESVRVMREFATGYYRAGAPDLEVAIVDVRDVADAHVQAALRPSASGRHVLSSESVTLIEIGRILREHYGDGFPFPRLTVPKFVVGLLAPLGGIPRAVVKRNVGYPLRFDNRYAEADLGIEFGPAADAIVDQFQQLLDDGLIPGPKVGRRLRKGTRSPVERGVDRQAARDSRAGA